MGVRQAQLSQGFFDETNRGFRVARRTLTEGFARSKGNIVLCEEYVKIFLKFWAKITFDFLGKRMAAQVVCQIGFCCFCHQVGGGVNRDVSSACVNEY